MPVQFNHGLGSYYEETHFKYGIGIINYYYSDGEPNWESSSLPFYDMSGTSCGTLITTAENEIKPVALQLFPNPAYNELSVKGLQGSGTATLINALGQVVQINNLSQTSTTVDVSRIPAGVYRVVMNCNGDRQTLQAVIMH